MKKKNPDYAFTAGPFHAVIFGCLLFEVTRVQIRLLPLISVAGSHSNTHTRTVFTARFSFVRFWLIGLLHRFCRWEPASPRSSMVVLLKSTVPSPGFYPRQEVRREPILLSSNKWMELSQEPKTPPSQLCFPGSRVLFLVHFVSVSVSICQI